MSDGQIPYIVEPMRPEDVEEVMAIERQSFPLPWSMTTYQHELRDNQHSHYAVVRQALPPPQPDPFWTRLVRRGQPRRAPVLGYGGFWLVVDEAHISTIATAPAWRGRGLGELVLLTMIEQGLGLGAHIVTLEVRISNIVAQNLYHKYGFVITGGRKHYYRDNGEDAHIMTVDNANAPEYLQRLQNLRSALWTRLRSERSPRSKAEPAGQSSGQKTRL